MSKKTKRKVVIVFILTLLVFTFSACASSASDNTSNDSADELSDTAAPESEPPTEDADTMDGGTPATEPSDSDDIDLDENGMISITITVGTEVFAAKFYDNESTRTIVSEMPFTLDMDDYASQEKVTGLSFALPSASTETPSTINAGDIYLWSGNSLVLFYTTFSNSYSYVPVGYIEDVAGLTNALGSGSATVAFQTAKNSDED